MDVTIEVFGPLNDSARLTLKNGPTDLCLEHEMSIDYLVNEFLGLRASDKIVLVNGAYVPANYTLKQGDTVQIFSPLPGG